jgi:hypothetical protein
MPVQIVEPSEGRLQLLKRINRGLKEGSLLCFAYVYMSDKYLSEATMFVEIDCRTRSIGIVVRRFGLIDWKIKNGVYVSWGGPLDQLIDTLQKSKATMGITAMVEFLLGGKKLSGHPGPREALQRIGFSQIAEVFNLKNCVDLRTGLARGTWRPVRKKYRPEEDPNQSKLF